MKANCNALKKLAARRRFRVVAACGLFLGMGMAGPRLLEPMIRPTPPSSEDWPFSPPGRPTTALSALRSTAGMWP